MRVETAHSPELGQSRLFWFDSPTEFALAANRLKIKHENKRWTGETWEQSVYGAIHGKTELVREAESMMELIRRQVQTPRSTWVPSVAGAYPIVPEAISGMPEPMRRRASAYESSAPIRVFVDLVSSAGVGRELLTRRGVATLALTMILAEERAVELHVVIGLGHKKSRSVCIIKLQTAPLNVASVCHALTSSGFVRNLGHSFCDSAENKPEPSQMYDWMFGYYPDDAVRNLYISHLKKTLGVSNHDFVVPPTFLVDDKVDDPVGFLMRSLLEHEIRQRDES